MLTSVAEDIEVASDAPPLPPEEDGLLLWADEDEDEEEEEEAVAAEDEAAVAGRGEQGSSSSLGGGRRTGSGRREKEGSCLSPDCFKHLLAAYRDMKHGNFLLIRYFKCILLHEIPEEELPLLAPASPPACRHHGLHGPCRVSVGDEPLQVFFSCPRGRRGRPVEAQGQGKQGEGLEEGRVGEPGPASSSPSPCGSSAAPVWSHGRGFVRVLHAQHGAQAAKREKHGKVRSFFDKYGNERGNEMQIIYSLNIRSETSFASFYSTTKFRLCLHKICTSQVLSKLP